MTLRSWNVGLGTLVLVCVAAFIGLQFLFVHLAALCDGPRPTGNSTASHCSSSNTTHFNCIVGWAGVTTSIVAFGSFALPIKSPQVLDADVGPVVFQMYMSVSIFLVSFLVLITTPWSFTWWGVLSAGLWVPTSLLSQVAIRFIGISVGQAMWAGVTVVVSFIWGVAMFGETPKALGLALFGLVLILVGIAGLSLCNSEPVKALEDRRRRRGDAAATQSLLQVQSDDDDKKAAPTGPASSRALLFGILAAVGTGLTNGSMLVPTKFAARSDPNCEFSGMGFIVSFGIGVMIVTSGVFVLYHLVMRKWPVFQPRKMVVPAFATGLMWSIGNFGSIFAAQYLGLAVGFALTQTCLVVAGLWGLTLLREVRGLLPIGMWSVSALVLLAGATLLSLWG